MTSVERWNHKQNTKNIGIEKSSLEASLFLSFVAFLTIISRAKTYCTQSRRTTKAASESGRQIPSIDRYGPADCRGRKEELEISSHIDARYRSAHPP